MVATCSTPKYISIHAPTRGATVGDAICLYELIISIHAPTRGATKYSKTTKITFEISIHAPTRGATVKIILWVSTSTFQSTLPRGERRMSDAPDTPAVVFQSTLPRGERQQFSPKSSLFSQQKLSKIFNLNNKLF